MYDFESLVEEVLKQKPDLGRTKLNQLIEEKKNKVGGGYLTDQGALFLVAGDIGVQLKRIDSSSDLSLKDLYTGANDITVVARVLAVYPVGTFPKKDGGDGKYRRLNLFDKNGVARLTIWEDLDAVERLGVRVDTPVRVASAYVKSAYDGKPTLNLGKRGRIEVLKDEALIAKIPSLSQFEKDIDMITESDVIAVRGVVKSESKSSSFTRNDGSQGTLTHFMLGSSKDTGAKNKQQRIVIWNGTHLPTVRSGDTVRVTNLRLKQQEHGDPELHGDSGTRIESIHVEEPAKGGLLFLVVGSAELHGSTAELLVADAKRTLFHLNLKDAAAESWKMLGEGDAVEVSPSEMYEDMMICARSDSIKRVEARPNLLPSIESLFVKVKDIETVSGLLLLEVIALSRSSVQDVRLKDGSTVKKGELLVGDDTGEIRVAAWRENASKISGVEEGERLQIIGATVQKSKMNTPILQISRSCVVKRMKSASAPTIDDGLRL